MYSRRRSEEHTSELQSHSEISYAVFCLKKKNRWSTIASRAAGLASSSSSSVLRTAASPTGDRKRPPGSRPSFFFNDPPTTEIYTLSYTLSLHDALPISSRAATFRSSITWTRSDWRITPAKRSEEHTSELQSHSEISYAVFCLKKKKTPPTNPPPTASDSQ